MPKLENKYKYKAKFSAFARVLQFKKGDELIALASLDNLKGIFGGKVPHEEDLLPMVANLFVGGESNLNFDALSIEDTIKHYKLFEKKFISLEHRRDHCVGYCVSANLSRFGTNEIISEEEALKEDIVNVSIGMIVWKILDSDLTDYLIEASNESSPTFGDASLSFEVGYTDYKIGVGSKTIRKAKIIDESNEEFAKYNKILVSNGGTGKGENGDIVYRVLAGEILPLGSSIVNSPASRVRGLLNLEQSNSSLNNNTQSNISQNNKSTVINIEQFNTEKIMTLKSIKDITDESLKQVAASAIIDLWETEIKKADDKFKAEKDEKQRAYAELEKKNADVVADLEKTKKEFEDLNKKFAELSNQAQAKEAQEQFTQRMAHFDAEYELSDEDRLIVKEDIQGLEDDKFNVYAKRMEILFREKNKKLMAEKAKKEAEAKEKKEVKASTETPVKDAVDAAKKEVKGTVPNASDNTNQSLFDKYKAAFTPEQCIQGYPTKK